MKKEKLKLSEIKVDSFLTSLEENQSETVIGGTSPHIIIELITLCICPIPEAEAPGPKPPALPPPQRPYKSQGPTFCATHCGWGFCLEPGRPGQRPA